MEVSPTFGAGSLRGLVMGNPSGFKSDSAVSLGEVSNATTNAVGTLDLDKVLGGAAKDAMEKGTGMLDKGKDSVGGTLKNLLNK